ncbi:hypothetical protein H7J74_05980 [Mycobacterium angelicum]|nr:hypothetical protein [Mycobacterium angelicum]MCV7196030.1 hypothetical protein [Mycobacterium angelicum]
MIGDIECGARIMVMIGRVPALAVKDDFTASVIERQEVDIRRHAVLIQSCAVVVLSRRGAVAPAAGEHRGADVLKVRVRIAVQQETDRYPALVGGVALVVARGKRKPAVDALQVGRGDDLLAGSIACAMV